MNKKIIYLDYAATTPPAREVVDEMTLGLNKLWGNASSEHILGYSAHKCIEECLEGIADFLKVDASSLTLTSGATESINIALKGVMRAQTKKKHMIAITTEHKATLSTAQALAREGYQVTFISPNDRGQITAEMFEAAITAETALITTLWVNNETGEIYDIVGISEIARKHKILLHVDATQALPHLEIDITLADLVSFTAHKIYGPKGIGILYKRNFPKIPMTPVLDGAKTELGNHIGTLANHQIMGLARAVKLLPLFYDIERSQNERQLQYLLDHLAPFGVTRNIKADEAVPAIINLHVPDVYSETLMNAVSHLCFSRGSACNSDETLPSHVLTELGYSSKHARESVRLSLGRSLLEYDLKTAVKDLIVAIDHLQKIARGEHGSAVLPAIHSKGGNIDLKLLEKDDHLSSHEYQLSRDDVVLNFRVQVQNDVVEHLSISLQGSPYILWFMNETAKYLRQKNVADWIAFRMNCIGNTQDIPQNELRLVMMIEKFIRESGAAMQA